MTFQIERVVESFATESAQIAFDFRMAFHVAIQQTLQRERFQANATYELRVATVAIGIIDSVVATVAVIAAIHQG